ncbi:Gtr1/RagA G protein conserved region-domain-containing protein [Gymnopilus junonius]|uniref:GTP-binding protein n=1 Tax=Gymnopilus junonius TaxID=109634 RepID=A0A9P5NUM6_GYMJU|nr:Gtr1/RagA G protein conserved region-domain-containing protein [Gymnopilus junonius]
MENEQSKRNGTKSPKDPVARTKILLLGLRRAGKTSIQQVLFNNLPPNQTFYLETTMRIVKHQIDSVIPLEIWDCPANTTVESLGVPLSQFSTIIFVIDIRDLYNQPISKLVEFIVASYAQNPDIILEVFVHKAEKLQEDDKIENFRQIHERVSDRLLDMSPEYEQIQLNFHLTSVYDHSLHEAFSRVLHKLIESLPFLEELLNVFCANSQSPKAFLFDVRSRLYVATDASPVDSATHNLCCDYLQMLNSFGPLYRSITASPDRQRQLTGGTIPVTPPPSTISGSSRSPRATSPASPMALSPVRPSNPRTNTNGSSGLLSPTSPVASTPRPTNGFHSLTSPARPPSLPHTNSSRSTLSPFSPPISTPASASASTPASASTNSASAFQQNATANTNTQSTSSSSSKPWRKIQKELFYPSASTTLSSSSTTSGGTTTLTYHLTTPHLALLALIPTHVYEERRGLVEYNVVFFREGVQEIIDVEEEARVG